MGQSVGLGCMGMVSEYPPIPEKKDMIRFAREAAECGETFFDTAEVYGPYTGEEILGEALHEIRNHVVIATKFGFPHTKWKIRRSGQPAGNYKKGQWKDLCAA